MSRMILSGHRNRGSGLSADVIPELEMGIVRTKQRGRTWYVSSAGASGGSGTSWTDPFTTLAAAIAAAAVDDTIYIAPLHAENVSAAGGIAISKAGLDIIGLGRGRRRPTFTFTATDATITITAAGVKLANVNLTCGVDEVVTAISVTAADVVLDAVDYFETTSYQLIQFLLTTAAADRIEVCNCVHAAATAAGSAQKWIQLVGVDDCYIHDNTFHLTLNNAAGSVTISGSTALVRGAILRNYIVQLGGATQVSAILLVDSSTSHVADNRAAAGTTALAGIIDVGNAGYANQNFALNTADKSGILDPVADS